MQILSRDSTQPENNKKSINKNDNPFCCELLNRTGLGHCVMQVSRKLCLALFEFFYCFRKQTVFSTRPTFDFKYLKKAKHRSNILNGLNIKQQVKKLEDTRFKNKLFQLMEVT